MIHRGSCHCGAIHIELHTDRAPSEQILGACQCSFCRKHNARAFSDPKSRVALTAIDARHVQRYAFGLHTSEQILCRQCGVYIGMLLRDGEQAWSVINIDSLDDRAMFTAQAEPRDFSGENRSSRIARRKARWSPTTLAGWPVTNIA